MFGSYDPPHLAHVEAAALSLKKNRLKEVWMAPVPVSPFKRNSKRKRASFPQKMEMCKILASPYQDWLKVSPVCEGFRAGYLSQLQNVKRTLEGLTLQYPETEFVLVSGADFRQKLLMAVQMLRIAEMLAGTAHKNVALNLSLLAGIAERSAKARHVFENIEIPEQARSTLTSSTEIVARIIAGEKPIPGLPEALHEYIEREEIYAPSPAQGL
jgi:nicotinic acid mononucleotide adenylyltransferase